MNRSTLFAITIGLLLAASSARSQELTIHEPYHSGTDLCSGAGSALSSADPGEFGFFVDVPIDYANPRAGTFKLYGWTMRSFNPALKSMVYFVGGPGDTSHSELGRGISGALSGDWNAIFFDQRGNTCSRPADKTLLLSSSFFSSENTARDANEIRKYLKIPKWSVYGQSYGTVPATIAGSLFPDSVRSVTISGVIYNGDLSLWEAPHRRQILQKYFDSLTEADRTRILAYSRRPDLPAFWFSALAFSKMYDNFPLQEVTSSLNSLLSESETDITDQLKAYSNPFSSMLVDYEFGFGAWLWAQLACRELSAGSTYANFSDVFNSRDQLVPAALDAMAPTCTRLGVTGKNVHTYRAEDYPISVPVTYIQGGMDGPTVAPEARAHWRTVPQAFTQFLYAPNGGHGIADSQEGNAAFVQVFESALAGDFLACPALKAVNAAGPLKFKMSSKFGDLKLLRCDDVAPVSELEDN